MPASDRAARMRWQCRRGMKELDELLIAYLDTHYAQAGADEKTAFEALLQLADPQLIAYLLGREEAVEPAVAAIVDRIRRRTAVP